MTHNVQRLVRLKAHTRSLRCRKALEANYVDHARFFPKEPTSNAGEKTLDVTSVQLKHIVTESQGEPLPKLLAEKVRKALANLCKEALLVPKQKREEQRSDMCSIHISIRQQNDLQAAQATPNQGMRL